MRLVAATNIDLARAVAAQHFRADLYYRLSVAGVRLPRCTSARPTSCRWPSTSSASTATGWASGRVPLSADAGDALRRYSWPGNIRELENVIHYALIVCAGDEIQPADLKLVPLLPPGDRRASAADAGRGARLRRLPRARRARGRAARRPRPRRSADARSRLPAVFDELLREGGDGLFDAVERALVHAAFEHAHRNQVRSAKALGVTRNMVRTLLKRHGLLAAGSADSTATATATGRRRRPGARRVRPRGGAVGGHFSLSAA